MRSKALVGLAVAVLALCVGPGCCGNIAHVVEQFGGNISDDWPCPKDVYLDSPAAERITDADFVRIANSVGSPWALRGLFLSSGNLTDKSVPAILRFSQLEELSLRRAKISFAGVRTLLRLPKLQTLGVPAASCSPRELQSLRREFPRVDIKAG